MAGYSSQHVRWKGRGLETTWLGRGQHTTLHNSSRSIHNSRAGLVGLQILIIGQRKRALGVLRLYSVLMIGAPEDEGIEPQTSVQDNNSVNLLVK